ncbi:hypothetical protein MMC06_003127 [Schaereria dolodes]|nr:hypothetical protein [Schaereria dolodes]
MDIPDVVTRSKELPEASDDIDFEIVRSRDRRKEGCGGCRPLKTDISSIIAPKRKSAHRKKTFHLSSLEDSILKGAMEYSIGGLRGYSLKRYGRVPPRRFQRRLYFLRTSMK